MTFPLFVHKPKSSSCIVRPLWSVSTWSWAGSAGLTHVGTRRLAGLSSRSGWCLAAAFISHAASGCHTHFDLSFISSGGRASCSACWEGRGSGVQHPNGPAGDQRLSANLNLRRSVLKTHPHRAEAIREMCLFLRAGKRRVALEDRSANVERVSFCCLRYDEPFSSRSFNPSLTELYKLN